MRLVLPGLALFALTHATLLGCPGNLPDPDAGAGDGDVGDGDVGDGDGDGDTTGDGDGDGDTTGDGDGDGDMADAGDGDGDGDADCDADNDNHLSYACGGDDCDDGKYWVHGAAAELCSDLDENCNNQNNENLDCTFVAHGKDVLYKVDPFVPSVEVLAEVDLPSNYGLLDIDINPQGQLLAVTGEGLYLVHDDGTLQQLQQVATPNRTNGMAINGSGTIFITNDDNEDSQAFTVDPLTGNIDSLGFLSPYVSSGDCVVLKNENLMMSAPDPYAIDGVPSENGDILVFVDSSTAATTPVGPIGFERVFGLSASFGYLFGVTDNGQLLRIDPATGAGTLIWEDANIRFWGAANGD